MSFIDLFEVKFGFYVMLYYWLVLVDGVDIVNIFLDKLVMLLLGVG